MAIVRPFKGIYYNPEKLLLKQVIAPPYDVISQEYREKLAERSPYNVVNIDLPSDKPDKYQVSARTFQAWLSDSILVKEQTPSIYLYEQEFDYNGKPLTRSGFIALLKIEKLGEGVVFPHEMTLAGPKKDRLDLLISTKTNYSPIFGLYIDQEERLKTFFNVARFNMPLESAVDDDKIKHSIWQISDKDSIHEVQSLMKEKAIYIADGHHRYETSLMYRDIMREKNNDSVDEVKPYDFVMMMFVNCFDPGLMILPTHRAVSFDAAFNEAKFIKELSAISAVTKLESYTDIGSYLSSIKTPGRFVMVSKTACYGINLDPELFEPYNPAYRNVDAYLLQKSVLENLLGMTEEQILKKQGIYFFQEPQDVISHVHNFNSMGFILKAASLETIRQVAENGLTMPQKTTYFFPKLATGLLFNKID